MNRMLLRSQDADAKGLLGRHVDGVVKSGSQGDRANVINGFCRKLDDSIDQLRQISRLIDNGAAPTFSLDLCELLQVSLGAPKKMDDKIHARRVMTEISFARAAMVLLRQNREAVTILPGAAVEILEYVKRRLSSNLHLLSRKKIAGRMVKSWDRPSLVHNVYDRFSNLRERDYVAVSSTNRLLTVVREMLSSPHFVNPLSLLDIAETSTKLRDSNGRFLAALNATRPDKEDKLANIADALNLSFVETYNCSARPQNTSPFLVHMTRTYAMHKVAWRSQATMELRVEQNLAGVSLPLLCHPRTVFLLSLLTGGGKRPGNLNQLVERFARYWSLVGSYMREIQNELDRGRDLGQLDEPMISLRAAIRNSEFAHVFREYQRLFKLGASESLWDVEDLIPVSLSDIGEQRRGQKEERIEAMLIEQQEKLLELHETLRHASGLAGSVLSSAGVISPSLTARLTLAERAGFRLVRPERQIEGLLEVWVVSENGPERREDFLLSSDDDQGLVLGLQIFETSGLKVLFWPTELMGIRKFFALVSEYCGASSALLTVVESDRRLIFEERTGSSLREVKISDHGFRVAQVETQAGEVFTIERYADQRRPLTSIRTAAKWPVCLESLYSQAGGLLPKDFVVDFLETYA